MKMYKNVAVAKEIALTLLFDIKRQNFIDSYGQILKTFKSGFFDLNKIHYSTKFSKIRYVTQIVLFRSP